MDLRKLKSHCRARRYPDREVLVPKEETTALLDGHDKTLPVKRMIVVNNGRFIVDCGWLLFFGMPKQRKNIHFYDSKGKEIA